MPSHPPQKLAQPLTPPGLPQAQAWGPGQLRLCRLGGSPPPRIVSWVHDSPSWEGPRGPGGVGLLIWVCFRFEPPRTQGAQLGVPLHPQEASPKVLGGQLPIRCSRKPPGGSLWLKQLDITSRVLDASSAWVPSWDRAGEGAALSPRRPGLTPSS